MTQPLLENQLNSPGHHSITSLVSLTTPILLHHPDLRIYFRNIHIGRPDLTLTNSFLSRLEVIASAAEILRLIPLPYPALPSRWQPQLRQLISTELLHDDIITNPLRRHRGRNPREPKRPYPLQVHRGPTHQHIEQIRVTSQSKRSCRRKTMRLRTSRINLAEVHETSQPGVAQLIIDQVITLGTHQIWQRLQMAEALLQ